MSFYNYLFATLGNHLLEALENELIHAAPDLSKVIVQEVELLITKLEGLIAGKKPNGVLNNPPFGVTLAQHI